MVTDPSTSPRTGLGKAMFGALYGLGVFALYALLVLVGVPAFYDKLLCVPLLNLSVQWIDRMARRVQDIPVVARWGEWAPARSNLAQMVVWAAFFVAMAALGKTDATHPGDKLPFWEQACADGRRNACDRLLQIEAGLCGDNSAWACNELAVHFGEGTKVAADAALAWSYFARACELGYKPGCFNILEPTSGTAGDGAGFVRADPRVFDLRLLLREGGRNLLEMPVPELYERACRHGWAYACDQGAG